MNKVFEIENQHSKNKGMMNKYKKIFIQSGSL